MDLLELSKIMMKATTGRDWSNEELLDIMKEARDSKPKNSSQYKKFDDYIKLKEGENK